MKHAGLHWANGDCNRELLAGYPGSSFLLCSPEARWHYDWLRMRRPDATIVWRAIPEPGSRPAELGYQPKKIADACALHWNEQEHFGTEHFLPLNELNLNYERGDDRDDFADLDARYGQLANMLAALETHLRARLPSDGYVNLHFPAWAPGHLEWEYLDSWKWAAEAYDVIHFHAYGSLAEIISTYLRYREAFPDKPLFLGEWNTGVNPGSPDFRVLGPDEERLILGWLAKTMEEDPLFIGASYFIYRWYDGWAENDFDVDGNPSREALFRDPPGPAAVQAPLEPFPPVLPPAAIELSPPDAINPPLEPFPVYTREAVFAIGTMVADEFKIPRALMIGCGIAESDLEAGARRPSDPSRDESFWPDVSGGAWQQTVRYDPDYTGGSAYPGKAEVSRIIGKQLDPYRSARVAAEQLRNHLFAQVRAEDDGDLLRYADNDAVLLATMFRYNWPSGGGKPYTEAHRRNYTDGLARARAELSPVVDAPEELPQEGWYAGFDREEYMPKQETDWTCSAATMSWMARSLGRDMTERDAVDLLADGINEDVGLRFASGTEFAGVLRGIGYAVTRIDPAAFDDVVGLSNHGPVGMGGRDFYHWVGIRSYDPVADVLIIANSAPGHKDVWYSMNRSQFNQLGAFAAVGIEAPHVPVDLTDEEDPAVIKELEARIAELEDQRAALISTVGYLTGDVADALIAAQDHLETKIEDARTVLTSEIDAVISTLHRHKAS